MPRRLLIQARPSNNRRGLAAVTRRHCQRASRFESPQLHQEFRASQGGRRPPWLQIASSEGPSPAPGGLEARFSQRGRWKRLVGRYIAVMPWIDMLEPEEQSATVGATYAAIHAISAKVREAARVIHPAARAWEALAPPRLAAEDIVIFRLPIDCPRPLLGPAGNLPRGGRRLRVISMAGFRWPR
jgi:hypothetical protein